MIWIFFTELSQVGKKILTMPRAIKRSLFRPPPPNDVPEECEDMSNSTMNHSTPVINGIDNNTPKSSPDADAINHNSTNSTNTRGMSKFSALLERNVCERTKSLHLQPRLLYQQKCARIVCMDAKNETVHMKSAEREFPSFMSV